MRRVALIFVLGWLAATSSQAADDPSLAPPVFCENGLPGGVNCVASPKQTKEAREAFERGLRLREHKRVDEAFIQFDEAARLVPQNPQFLTARELAKAQLVFHHVERGNAMLAENTPAAAAAEFRAALELDPDNNFVRERLVEAAGPPPGPLPIASPENPDDSDEIHLQPKTERATFHFQGDVRGLFNELGSAYGVTVQFDDPLQNRQLRFNVEDVDFFTALKLACRSTKTMWAVLDSHQLLIANDNPENHRQFDRMSLRTFVLPSHASPQEVTEMSNAMRAIFTEVKVVKENQSTGTVQVRAPAAILEACARWMAQIDQQRPQVMLEVRVYQISHQLARNIGVHVPNTFNMFNIPATALAGLGGQNIQQLINQLISSGGINQAGGTALSGLLAQLGGQNSIFSQPLATFGGGLTFMGLSLDQLAASLSLNESWVRSLEHMTLRAGQGTDATFHLGERFPILNASYAPIYNSPQISQVLGNQTYVPPFPSVSYEDIGLNVKAKPTIHGNRDVGLDLEMQVRSLTGQSNNGVPIISNREYKGSIVLKDGEPAFVTGEISQTDTISMTGVPGLGFLPGLSQLATNHSKQVEYDELMVVITPHVLANTVRIAPEIWVSEK